MSGALKISLTLAGATGTAGGGFLIREFVGKKEKIDSISNHIKTEYLLTDVHSNQWAHRLELLNKAKDVDLSAELLANKKSKDSLTVSDLKKWCSRTLKEKFDGIKDNKFLDVRLYCGLNIGDKIEGNKVVNGTTKEEPKLASLFSKLNGKSELELGSELFEISKKTNQSTTWEGSEALKEWCLRTFDLAFEENSRNHNNTKTYCVLV